jgi:hypothetical protein
MKRFSAHAILVLIAASPLFRGLFFAYETYAVLAGISLLAFLYFFHKIRNNEVLHINKLYFVLSIILVTSNILSSITAVNPRENLGSILLYTELAIIFIVLYDYFFEKKQEFIKEIMFAVVIIGFGCAVIGLEALTYSFNLLDITIFDKRLGSTFQYTNTASIYFVICILFSATLVNALKNTIIKAVLTGAGNIFILAFFMTGSRAGYLTGMSVILFFLLFQPVGHKLKNIINFTSMLLPLIITYTKFANSASSHDYLDASRWMIISFLLSASIYILFYIISKLSAKFVFKKGVSLPKGVSYVSFFVFILLIVGTIVFWDNFITLLPDVLGDRLKNISLNEPNLLYRIEFDKDALKLASQNWLLGVGGGGWLTVYQSIQEVYYTANFTHNNYLQVFAESGIFGFLSYSAIIIIACISAFISYFKVANKEHKTNISGLLCGILALAVHSAFDFDLTYISLLMFFWVMFAAASIKLEPEKIKWENLRSKYFTNIIPAIISAALLSMYALYFTGAYNANEGNKHTRSKNYKSAILYYEEANRLDPLNASYLFELSKLYYYYAKNSKNDEEHSKWINKAISFGEAGISYNRYYPPQLKTLILIYNSEGMPIEALEYTRKLVQYQRCKTVNYESLAKAYIDAAKYYREENNIEMAKKLLAECISIKDDPSFIKSNITIANRLAGGKNDHKDSILYKYISESKELLEELN